MQLTDHFSLAELIASTEARKRGIDNTPSAETVDNLRRLAQTLEHWPPSVMDSMSVSELMDWRERARERYEKQ